MSRAYESSLTNLLARLDHYIAESEALASRSTDEDTLRHVAEELVRLRESRRQQEETLRRTRSINRFVRWVLATFCISFVILLAMAFLRLNGKPLTLVAVDVLVVIGAGIMYVIAITVRDAVALGHQPWRFSLRSLLITTTVVGVVLGLLVFALKK